MDLKERLRALRVAIGLTQEQLAERSGLDRIEVSNLESGRNQATSVRMLVGIARGFGLSLDDALALIEGSIGVEEARALAAARRAAPAPSRDPFPARAEAARLARAAGVYEAAVESVLAEAPPPGAEALPVLWWADQMRLRQHQLVSNTGQIPKVQRVPPPHPSAPRRRDPFEPDPAPSSRTPVHESGEIPREIDPDQAQEIHRRDRDRALGGAVPPADTRKKSRG